MVTQQLAFEFGLLLFSCIRVGAAFCKDRQCPADMQDLDVVRPFLANHVSSDAPVERLQPIGDYEQAPVDIVGQPSSLVDFRLSEWQKLGSDVNSFCSGGANLELCSSTLHPNTLVRVPAAIRLLTDGGQLHLSAHEAPPGSDLQSMFALRQQGYLGGDAAASILLADGLTRVWLMGDTLLGAYDAKTCARKVQHLVRNAIIVMGAGCSTDCEPSDFSMKLDTKAMCFNYANIGDVDEEFFFSAYIASNKSWDVPAKDFAPGPRSRFLLGIAIGGEIKRDESTLILIGSQIGSQPLQRLSTDFVQVANPTEPPHQWTIRKATLSIRAADGMLLTLHSGAAKDPHDTRWVYLLGCWESAEPEIDKRHKIFASRVELERLKSLDISKTIDSIEFLVVDNDDPLHLSISWRRGLPRTVRELYTLFDHEQGCESSLMWSKRMNLWLALSTDSNSIVLHSAQSMDDVWIRNVLLVPQPTFDSNATLLCNTPKFHEELGAGPDQIVISLACSKQPGAWAMPRFVTIQISESYPKAPRLWTELLRRHAATSDLPQIIWTYWEQGNFTGAGRLNQICLSQWSSLNPTWHMHILNRSSVQELFPALDDLFKSEPKTVQQRSDMLRLWLLAEYGGVWVDASLLPLIQLDHFIQYLVEPVGFFAFQYADQGYLASWFLAAMPKNSLVLRWKDAFMKNWKSGKNFHYFELHHTLVNLVVTNLDLFLIWKRIPLLRSWWPHSCIIGCYKYWSVMEPKDYPPMLKRPFQKQMKEHKMDGPPHEWWTGYWQTVAQINSAFNATMDMRDSSKLDADFEKLPGSYRKRNM